MEVGDKLNPQRSLRKRLGLKGIQQHITKTNNSSMIGPDELLAVTFPDVTLPLPSLLVQHLMPRGVGRTTFGISKAVAPINVNFCRVLETSLNVFEMLKLFT